jgi:hypothetical protein
MVCSELLSEAPPASEETRSSEGCGLIPQSEAKKDVP